MSKCVFLCRKSRGQVKDGENKDRLKCVIDEDSIICQGFGQYKCVEKMDRLNMSKK